MDVVIGQGILHFGDNIVQGDCQGAEWSLILVEGAMTALVVCEPGPVFAAWLKIDKKKILFVENQVDLAIGIF